MKKSLTLVLGAALVVSSCTSYTGAGAYMGTSLGSILGSAIGGIAGGPRGSDIGTIVGMAGGAVVGSAIGAAVDNSENARQYDEARQSSRRNTQTNRHRTNIQRYEARQDGVYGGQYNSSQNYSGAQANGQYSPDGVFDSTNSADDRIDFDAPEPTRSNLMAQPSDTLLSSNSAGSTVESVGASALEHCTRLSIRNVRFTDSDGDGALARGEIGRVTFELYNMGQTPVYAINPSVVEQGDGGSLYISPSILVENIDPGKGIRYTATVKGGRKLRDGKLQLYVSAMQGGKPVSHVTVLNVTTKR